MSIDRLPELSIRSSNFGERVDGDPIRSLGWIEIAAALASVPTEASDLVRAIYLLEQPAMNRTHGRLMEILSQFPMTPGLRDEMALAILRAYAAMRACRFCNGEGRHWHPGFLRITDAIGGEVAPPKYIKGRYEPCVPCKGDGYDHVQAAAVQLMMRVSAEVWEAMLVEPFGLCYEWLRETHDTARRIIASRTRREK
jgi:hypothetical protein